MPQTFQIAIDGPEGAGKSTVARGVAQALGFLYVDTGAMYRATALLAIRNGVDLSDEEAIHKLLLSHTLTLAPPQGDQLDGRQITVYLNDEDVSHVIRTPEVTAGSSVVAQYAKVRAELVKRQQQIAETHNVVMEGRDITFRVLPEAQLKIYLTASEEERARRRHDDYLRKGTPISYEEVLENLRDREHRDMNRDVDPLHQTEDAWLFDCTEYTLQATIDRIVGKAREVWQSLENEPAAR